MYGQTVGSLILEQLSTSLVKHRFAFVLFLCEMYVLDRKPSLENDYVSESDVPAEVRSWKL